MKKFFAVGLVLSLLFMAGCKEPAPPPAPKKAEVPVEPSPQQILAEISPGLQPLRDRLAPNTRGFLADAQKAAVIKAVTDAKAKCGGTENGREALKLFQHDLEALISEGRDKQKWLVVVAGIEAYELLNPGVTKMIKLKERAMVHINRPRLDLVGFFDDKKTGDTYVFLKITKRTGEVEEVHVRKGEEFSNFRLVDIVGQNSGVTVEYLPLPGQYQNVMKQ